MRPIAGPLVALIVGVGACAPPEPLREAASTSGEPGEALVVEIVCRADGSIDLLTPRVAVRADGVHVRVRNLTDETVSISGLPVDADLGVSEHVITVPPGEVGVGCWPFSEHKGPQPTPLPLALVDPNGYWVSPDLECLGVRSSSTVRDYFPEAEGERGDPLDVARRLLVGLRPTDTVRRVGYPESTFPIVAVVRDGRTVATVRFFASEGGGWLLGSEESCYAASVHGP